MTCALLFSACSQTNDPDGEIPFDVALVGEWYRVREVPMRRGAPAVEVTGMRIASDGGFSPLGVESGTGRLALLNDKERRRIPEAREGRMTMEVMTAPGMTSEFIYSYRIEGDTLKLYLIGSQSLEEVYVRSAVGTVVAEPVAWGFSVVVRDESDHPVTAHGVYPYPAAYATRVLTWELGITAYLPEGEIFFDVKDFQGVGEYRISPGERILILRESDRFTGYISDLTSPGTVIIDRYDEDANICSGTFSALVSGERFGIPEVLELRDGRFSVPIYR